MYTPSQFVNRDVPALHAMMRMHPFALLLTPQGNEVQLTHLPFRLDSRRGPQGTLEAHIARINPHCEAILAGAPCSVVFQGPDGYVSPRWYEDPAKNVPTWNYVAIHAHGRPKPIADPTQLLALIGRLTDEHEAYIEKPWSIREAQAHAEHLAQHILGFELEIEELEGKFKLSQNRSDGDRAGVLKEFAKSKDGGVQEMLGLMRGLYDEDGKKR
ncbi:MAG TPA: FMN-binding negative transcriptional regulator [Gammaproteobacteria bacterium]|jgi:transcriptional regulator|nr:FMN-binding negative transcriptional regulator [Gammaproteobacteria bacterium]